MIAEFANAVKARFPNVWNRVSEITGLNDQSAIGMAAIAGIVMVIVGGIMYMLGIFLVSTVSTAMPAIINSTLNTSQVQANTNITSSFNIVGIGLVVGGIISILYEVMPLAALFTGGRR